MAVNPPRPRMPPLNALRAFEAAARHESFAKAADELGVTPAAVSHQVKALEAWLGSSLFVRHPQGLHLTEAGRAALPAFSTAFDAMGLAVQELRISAPRPQVSIAALPSIAQLWLAPRLPALRAAHPALRPSIHALEVPPDFRREPFDLAIFLTRHAPAGSRAFKLSDDVIFPVCAPALAGLLKTPADLSSQLLLWDTTWTGDWSLWFDAAGLKGPSIESGSEFSLYSMALQAAVDGAGVLMGHEALVSRALATGSLVAPFPERRVPTGLSLSILAPDRPPAQAAQMIDWLLAQSAVSQG
ncbi:LysR family transcriptional regulator [Mesorhizobium waimense]|uniref:LysR family transcriptional regulator n=1 Tax=Mesorhizobium waimense TaxID=1300307 RepID=A0A3A5KST8_9HYPH|nr:LysR substrate-binding domain-containing protein [Mesorhizobium waimense]RJT36325.1 LysR family transcriptional regulator [Mesorhizobium waimense]